MPVFSIIIPVYNAEKYLDQCVQSVLAQTFSDFELYLIHDITGDRSGEICDRYAAEDNRVKVIHNEKKMGVSAARNKGIELSAGDWLTFIDADDWIEPNMLEVSLEHLAVSHCDMLMFDAVFEYKTTSERIRFFKDPLLSMDRKFITSLQEEIFYPYISTATGLGIGAPWGKIFKKGILCDARIRFPEGIDVAEDLWFLVLYFDQTESFQYIKIPLYHYRNHNGSACRRYRADFEERHLGSMEFGDNLIRNENLRNPIDYPCFYTKMASHFPMIARNILHKDNPARFKDKLRQIKSLCEDPYFYNASRFADTTKFIFRHKILCYLIKTKSCFFLWLGFVAKDIVYFLTGRLKF